MYPLFLLANIIAGINLISKKKSLVWVFVSLLIVEGVLFGTYFFDTTDKLLVSKIKFFIYFLFYVTVSYEIIRDVWRAKHINKNVIFGLISGYISLSFIGLFIYLSVDIWYPNSFNGVDAVFNTTEELMYFSYITLMSIGYGDITPRIPMAQKATIFIGLMGHFIWL